MAAEEGRTRSRRRETTPGCGSPLNGDILAETSGLGGAQKGTQYCTAQDLNLAIYDTFLSALVFVLLPD